MGGQACVSYGAAEFSRDVDFAILASPSNLGALRKALKALAAEVIAVPPFEVRYLRKGHALHFRCHDPQAEGLRVDVMSRMRGVASFETLWRRRTTVELPDGSAFDLLSLPDLVRAKKTQRDKDWPMIRRLLEADFFQRRENAMPADIRFWFAELRTPDLLIALAGAHPVECRRSSAKRPLLRFALRADPDAVTSALIAEEAAEREADRAYWQPLREELEQLRHHNATRKVHKD
jgi:hypothetical protein